MEGAVPSTGRRLLRREERQASILRGAAAAFARSGFAATSMDDVADACGVSRLILYRNFSSKEDLYRAVLQRVFDRQADVFVLALQRGDGRAIGFRTLLTVAREHPDGFPLLWRHAAREPQFAEYAHEHRGLAVDATLALLQLDADDEVLDRWIGEVVYSWVVESVLLWLEHGDPGKDEDAVDRSNAAVRAIVASLRAGAMPDGPDRQR
ncbi:MAG: TetR/AcrR family transcriptional regulator [Actinomycetota bacterium]|nr:helix-turn-helix transcriptional regulator [Acidimicrobiia bacterium]MDQ3294077.1 TetR/AcrR family transcriptional regulator [Actinomycetota bacterium]